MKIYSADPVNSCRLRMRLCYAILNSYQRQEIVMMRKSRFICLFASILACCLLFACGGAADPSPSHGTIETPAVSEQPGNTPETENEVIALPTNAPETEKPVESIALFGQTVSSDAESIELSEPVEDVSPLFTALADFPQCRSVEVTRNYDPENGRGLAAFEKDWNDLTSRYPNIAFTGHLLINGTPAETLKTYTVPSTVAAQEELFEILRCCPALQTVDLSETAAARDVVLGAAKDAPNVRFLWTDEVFGASDTGTDSLSFAGEQDAEALISYLDCFPNLTEVDVFEAGLSEEQVKALCERYPKIAFRRSILLNGKPTDSFAKTLDFSNAKIASYDAFSDALAGFPKLTRLEMHECNLSDEQLAGIRDRYPNIKVVWTVRVKGRHVRTDAIAFSSKQLKTNTNRITSENAKALRYCTDLIALDLGHNDLTDIEWIRPLKNLQVLILADNRKLKDISPLAELKNLKYIELFLTNVSDISPLAEHTALLDVNLCFSKITDISPLLSCKKLERIWLGGKTAADIGKEGIDALTNAFPNVQYDFSSMSTSTGAGWREHPRYDAYILMFKTNEPVDPFLP